MRLFERLKAGAPDAWAAYVDHEFVRRLGDGSLPEAAFRRYLVQDYLFLIQFARAYALAVYKGRTLADMRAAQRGLSAILDMEMDLHVGICAGWGISPAELEATPEHRATTAYTRFVLDAGMAGDLLDLHVVLSPCVIGYAEIARRLSGTGVAPTNPYRAWVEEYAGPAYGAVADAAVETLDRLADEGVGDRRLERLTRLFAQACLLEADFWQMGLADGAGPV